MPDHLSEEQIARYRGRHALPEELLGIDDHISRCPQCRERLTSANELRAALQRTEARPLPHHGRNVQPAPVRATSQGVPWQNESLALPPAASQGEHLAYEQLEAYVDSRMPDAERELVQVHLESCPSCSEDVRDLQTFKVELASSKGHSKEGWWAAFIALWLTRRRIAFALAMAAAIVLAVAVGKRRLTSPHGVSPVETANSNPPGKETLSAINALPPEEQSAVLDAISQQKIKSPDVLASLHRPHETLLGESTKSLRFEVVQPLGIVVAEVRPVFRWQPLAKAASYSVAIFDLNLNPVQSSPPLQTTEWTAARPLKRGQVYLWQVTAKLSDGESVSSPSPPNPEARFLVLDQRKADEISHFQASHPKSYLALGILYAEAGLLEQGELELEQVPESDPYYALAQKLLKSIQELRHPQH